MNDQGNWYVVYTYPNSEKKVYNELMRRKMRALLPTRKEVRQWSDRKKNVEVPLFPNYVFIKTPSEQMWMVLTIPGVARFVAFNGVPAVVKESEIDWIKEIMLNSKVEANEISGFKGEKVQVKQGPLKGLIGRVLDKKGMTRLYVELEAIQQTISIEIDSILLESMEEACEKGA